MASTKNDADDSGSEWTLLEREVLLSVSNKELEQQRQSRVLISEPIPEPSPIVPTVTTTTGRPQLLFEILDEVHEMHKIIHGSIHTMYTKTIPPAEIALANGVSDDDRARAYEMAEHVVAVLRHFETILNCLQDKGRAETATLLADYACDSFDGWLGFYENHKERLQRDPTILSSVQIMAINKYYADACCRVGASAFSDQLQVILNSGTCALTAYISPIRPSFMSCADMYSEEAPKAFECRQVAYAWATAQRELLSKFVRSCTNIYPPERCQLMARGYVDYASNVLATLDSGNYMGRNE